jgi:acetyltransferase
MTTRNLEALFSPRSIAVIGASERIDSVGTTVYSNIMASEFPGAVWPVNPKYASVAGRTCYARVADLPDAPDLAVIATPAHTVPGLIAEVGARGARAAVVLSAGITEANGLRRQMLEGARPHLLRIVGPNTIGVMVPGKSVNASFSHIAPPPGSLALLSQSGAMATTLIDWACSHGIGFSHVVSMGDMADVDFGDCLDMLAQDRDVGAVLMYLESVTNARKFMSAARALSRLKPIVAVKAGRHARSAEAASTHTGALAGEDSVFNAAFERAGIVRADTLEELFAAAQVLTRLPARPQGGTAILTNGGGAGVMALDALLDRNGKLAQLSSDTISALDSLLPVAWSHTNPVDILGDASPRRYAEALAVVAADPGVDTILALACPTALASSAESAAVLAPSAPLSMIAAKPVIASWLGGLTAAPARQTLDAAGIVNFDTPAQAVEAIAFLEQRAQRREAMMRVPTIGTEDTRIEGPDVAPIIDGALTEGRTLLSEDEAKHILSRFGIAIPKSALAATIAEVGIRASELLSKVDTVAIKLVSKTITHKSDVGGVILGLRSKEACESAAKAIAERLAQARPGLVPDGYLVQEMIALADAREVLIGTHTDPIFGPVIVFGAGGVAAEILNDTAIALPPLDDKLAGDLIEKTRISKLLEAHRNVPAANRYALIAALLAVSRLIVQMPQITSLDINPLLVGPQGVVALDARMVIASTESRRKAADRLCLKPYPSGWNTTFRSADGTDFEIRPIRPTDAALYPAFLNKVSANDIRMRFNVAMSELPRDMLVRLTQIDYDREMAFVALQKTTGSLSGVVRLSAEPDHQRAEYAILIRSDMQGRGLGWALLEHLLAYARADGLATVFGTVYAENAKMLEMCRQMGFSIAPAPEEPGVALVEVRLQAPAGPC